jgi:hypothetical protein
MVKKLFKSEYIIIALLAVIVLYLIYQHQPQHQPQPQPHTRQLVIPISSDNHLNATPNLIKTDNIKVVVEQPASPFPPTYTDDIRDPNVMRGSYWNYTNRKAMDRIVNPLLPPERSYEQNYGVPINVPNRGLVGGYQQVGMLYKDEIADPEKKPGNNTDSTVVALYGRPVDTSRNKWTYYATGDGFQAVKIPVTYKGRKCDSEFGCEEITSSDEVAIPPYNGKFKAEIYDYDKPRYIPSVW